MNKKVERLSSTKTKNIKKIQVDTKIYQGLQSKKKKKFTPRDRL